MIWIFNIALPLLLAALFSPLSFSDTGPQGKWDCGDVSWPQESQLVDGIFSATVSSRCRVQVKKESAIQWLFEALQNEYHRGEKYKIHEGPLFSQEGAFKVVTYDLTDKVSEEGSDLAIRQNVTLKSDNLHELIYFTQSKSIEASGTAAYLRSVSFETEVKELADSFQVDLKNQVQIEKPWFALGFLFKPLSESITKDKFLKAQDKLIRYLLPHS